MDATTGEVVDLADHATAERYVAAIDGQLARANQETGLLVDVIADALRARVWVALGHGSWEELVKAKGWEFRPATNIERAALALKLRESGMSLRAIGRVVGSSKSQVERDLAGVPSGTPAEVTGEDGKSYPATRPAPSADELAAVAEHAAECDERARDLASAQDDPGEAPIREDGGIGGGPPATADAGHFPGADSDPLTDYLDGDETLALLRFRAEAGKAMSRAQELCGFDPERLALSADADLNGQSLVWGRIDRLRQSLDAWFARMDAQRSTGLRVVEGGRS